LRHEAQVSLRAVPGSSDIALISLGTTPGLRRADAAFADACAAAGVSCQLIRVEIGALGKARRQMTATDLIEARAARAATQKADAKVIVFSTVTASLMAEPDAPYAIRFDSPAALNRPGRAGAWQRRAERKAMEGAIALLPWGEAARAALDPRFAAKAIPLHVPIEFLSVDQPRDIEVLAYAGYPEKRGLDLLIRAWNEVGGDHRLVVTGIERERAADWLHAREVPIPDGVEFRGLLEREEWQATLRRARIFANASRREDHGLSQLEALAAGALLVTVPSIGPYEALPIAQRLEPRFVSTAIDAYPLARTLRAAFDADAGDYPERAARELEPFSRAAVQDVFEREVLPALGLR
jgi:glycosyltransferase involved in cell wall biosynthesis